MRFVTRLYEEECPHTVGQLGDAIAKVRGLVGITEEWERLLLETATEQRLMQS
jgi:hypothetical protein